MAIVREVDVVIIGAGLAGLSAALKLQEQNISFCIVEARDRPGGRAYSFQTEDQITIDMGAQWIEKGHLRMKKLLSKYGLKTVPTYKKGKTIHNIGGQKQISKLPPLTASGLVDVLQLIRKLNSTSEKIDPVFPWNGRLASELDIQTFGQFLKANMYTASGRNYFQYVMEEMLCTYLHEVSALDVLWCIKTAGSVQKFRNSEALWVKSGIGQLPQRIAEELQDHIFYNSPVVHIEYDEQSAFVTAANGSGWKVKQVIVAIPLNLQGNITYQPPLPALRTQLLERSGLPSVIKIVVVYEKTFWRERGLS